jgi:hypothetical protein
VYDGWLPSVQVVETFQDVTQPTLHHLSTRSWSRKQQTRVTAWARLEGRLRRELLFGSHVCHEENLHKTLAFFYI